MHICSIVVDDCEARSEVFQHLSRTKDVCVSIRRLDAGDYQIDESLLIERKTMRDFAASLVDGRLFRQASRMTFCDKRSAIILEGTNADMPDVQIRREAIQGAIVSLALKFGIPILRSGNPLDSARLLCLAARQFTRMPTRFPPRAGKRPTNKEQLQLHILQGLPLIGPGRAWRLILEILQL